MNKKVVIFSAILSLTIFLLPTLYAQQKPGPYDTVATGILKLVNAHRAGMGLKPMEMNATITAAAESHSRNMATKKIPFGHRGFDARMDKLSKQITPTNSFAENVAYGPTNSAEAVDLWLGSPGHKKNIEGDYNITGIGIVKGKDGELYYTQIFLNRGK